MSQAENKKLVYSALSEIPDPEIPVINIVEMGMIRDVLFHDEKLEVLLSPTYSGCPAMDMIEDMVIAKLEGEGFRDIKITLVYKPAWTTDWMNADTREKLRAYGIAPPKGTSMSKIDLLNEGKIACPQCGSDNTQIKSMFGSTACKALYSCANCLETFDYFKCI